MNVFIVISLFNEEKHIAKVVKSVNEYKLPIIVVDDGSSDKSVSKVWSLGLKNVTILEHKINLGKGAAMKTGAEYAFGKGADAVIFMDADEQHKASDLSKFIDALVQKKAEVVFGSRNLNFGVPLVRFLGNKIASLLMAVLFKIYVTDSICGFRALSKNAYKKVKWSTSGYGVELEMVARVGKSKIGYLEVPVETIYHDKVKGVTAIDAFGILFEVVKLWLTI